MVNPTYQQECLNTVIEEAKPLLEEHWKEIALNQESIKLNPDWEAYEELEKSNMLKIFTARVGDKLIGYFVVFVGKNLHYKDHLFAVNDLIFLKEEYRKGFTGIKLIKFAEDCLKEDGVSVININTKLHKPFGSLLNRLGFEPIEKIYSKYIGE